MTLRDLMNWDKSFNIPVLQTKDTSNPFLRLQDEMNRLFETLYRGTEVYTTNWGKLDEFAPAVDIIENENHFRVDAELPGISPDNVEVSITKDNLTIKGNRKEEKEEKGENYIRHETSCGSFYRQLPLPQTADTDKAEATFKNGILSIKVLKKADAVHKARKLEIKKAA